ncbi:MAG: D-sedoheptulose 7-phosphate isomerase [Nitrospirae bacterium]|nr:D-sedoheptulose 7-phosphate isomerase [Nitrospirota bacterium]
MTLEKIRGLFRESADLKVRFIEEYAPRVEEVSRRIAASLRAGGKLILMGNGGSACDASHLAAELVNRFQMERSGLSALALATDMAVLTSISNDYDYSLVFRRQWEALAREGDVTLGISTSGNSVNVLRAVEAARDRGMPTIGFTGGNGGKLGDLVDYPFIVPSRNTARIQEVHITLGHAICQRVEEILFEEGK